MPTTATVTHPNPKLVPILTAGEVSPEVLFDWASACEVYFEEKDIADNKRVAKILGGLQDTLARNWYLTNAATLKALTWEEFLKKMKKRFLHPRWVDNLGSEMLAIRQGEGEAFNAFSERMLKYNAVLRETSAALDDEHFIRQITAAMCPDLRAAVIDETIMLGPLKNYDDWSNAVILLDDRRMGERERISRIFNAGRTSRNKQTVTVTTTQSNGQPTGSGSNNSKGLPNTAVKLLSKLTEAERKLLMDNEGCFKCRRFFAGHMSKECLNPWPDANTYKTLTAADVAIAAANKRGKKPTTVAAISDDTMSVVAAVNTGFPHAATTGILGNGTDSSDDEWVCPISVPHISWEAIVHNDNGPTYPSPIRTLIDSASPLVLIDDKTASQYELRRRKLPEPQSMCGAFDSKGFVATEWVKLRLSSPCFSWTSKSVRAIVVPKLCYPVILGQPFLKLNALSIENDTDNVIHKPTGTNITCPRSTITEADVANAEADRRRRDREKTEMERVAFRKDWKERLMQGLREWKSEKGGEGWEEREDERRKREEHERTMKIVGAVRERCENLVLIERLKEEDRKMKEKFRDRFPDDIPHISELPTNIYH